VWDLGIYNHLLMLILLQTAFLLMLAAVTESINFQKSFVHRELAKLVTL